MYRESSSELAWVLASLATSLSRPTWFLNREEPKDWLSWCFRTPAYGRYAAHGAARCSRRRFTVVLASDRLGGGVFACISICHSGTSIRQKERKVLVWRSHQRGHAKAATVGLARDGYLRRPRSYVSGVHWGHSKSKRTRKSIKPVVDLFFGAVGARLLGAGSLDRLGPSRLIPPALFLYILAASVVAFAETSLTFYIAGILGGIAHGYCFPLLASQVTSRNPAELRGSAIAFYTPLWDLSGLLLTPVFGFVANQYSDRMMYLGAAFVSLTLMPLWFRLERKLKSSRLGRE